MKKKVKKQKAAPIQKKATKVTKAARPTETGITRNALMLQAKECGIKNFRVLNKSELEEVLKEGVTAERIQEVVTGAVSRWKAGWGSKKNKQ